MGMRGQSEFNIKVPASIANLGPGFDTLAVAVKLYLRLRVRVVSGRGVFNYRFVDQELRGENYIERAFVLVAGPKASSLPSLDIAVHSEIPMCSGLGSSAAATVAGIRLLNALGEPFSEREMLNAAAALEGHPDNVAAALFGGLTASCQLQDGSVAAARMAWPAALKMIVLTPDVQLRTADSREVLPQNVSRHDAVFNLQRVALLLNCLQSQDYSLFRESLTDRLHQPYREALVPGLSELMSLEHPDLLGVCLSGAGPSIVAFATSGHESVAALLSRTLEARGIKHSVRTVEAEQPIGSLNADAESVSLTL
jgi:homoserine kinase